MPEQAVSTAVRGTLGETLLDNATHFGEAPAVIDEKRSVTHGELYRRAHRIAAAWRQMGLTRSDRVAFLAMNCVEVCEIYAASEMSVIPLVCMNYRLARNEIALILRDSTPSALFFEAQYVGLVESLRTEFPNVRHLVCLSHSPHWASDFEQLLAQAPTQVDWDAFAEDSLNCILYTSGTTGQPKGCMISHRGFRRLAELLSAKMTVTPSDRGLVVMPLFHMGGKAVQLGLHWQGAELFLHRKFEVATFIRTVREKKITVIHLAPTLIQSLLDHPDLKPDDLRSVRVVLYSAAPMPEPLLRRGLELLGPVFVQSYGQSEVMGLVLPAKFHQLDGGPRERRRLTSVGYPPPGVRAVIADDKDVECPRETPGEILIQSPTAMLGYWNNSAATAETMRGGWVHTGDVGVMDEDGFIYLVDRKKDVIISGGENIYSREVENALYQHPAVLEAAVIGVPDEKWGESVRAVVTLRKGAHVEAPDLITHCQSLIASYKKPSSILFVDELPKLASSKIDKTTIRKLYGANYVIDARTH